MPTESSLAASHENFHRQPIASQPGMGVAMMTSRGNGEDDGMQNGSLDEGIMFRARSNHIAGSYPPDLPGSYPPELPPESLGGSSSSHEQLHCVGSAAMDAENKEFQGLEERRTRVSFEWSPSNLDP